MDKTLLMSYQATPRRTLANDPGQLLLSDDQLSTIAKDSGFIKRRSAKFSAYAFIYGFFQTAMQGKFTLQAWASKIAMFFPGPFSRQALFEKLDAGCVCFLQQTLLEVLQRKLPSINLDLSACGLSQFTQVLVEDSTCIQLPDFMREAYPGANNQKKKTAIAKVQTICDMLTHSFLRLEVTSYRKNDQSQAACILSHAVKGALLLRDMGYFSLDSLKDLMKKEVDFIGRLPFGIKLYDLEGRETTIRKWIGKAKRREGWVLLGAEKKLKVRLIMVKLPKKVANDRKQKARKDKHRKANHGKDYLFCQGYTIIITSVSEDKLSMDQICRIYRLRWRIEIVFKSWKSCFGLARQFKEVKTKSRYRIEAMLYLLLLYTVMVQAPAFNYFARKIYALKGKLISWLSFANFLHNNYISSTWRFGSQMIEKVAASCQYQNKKGKINFPQLLALA